MPSMCVPSEAGPILIFSLQTAVASSSICDVDGLLCLPSRLVGLHLSVFVCFRLETRLQFCPTRVKLTTYLPTASPSHRHPSQGLQTVLYQVNGPRNRPIRLDPESMFQPAPTSANGKQG
ncbi:hypothetical protein LZ31DRAFT_159598 [Colletotrichum somersetense]|nr:hypothetical protein LZ31DRAFT_159598 [Colletotrichum somersetense]